MSAVNRFASSAERVRKHHGFGADGYTERRRSEALHLLLRGRAWTVELPTVVVDLFGGEVDGPPDIRQVAGVQLGIADARLPGTALQDTDVRIKLAAVDTGGAEVVLEQGATVVLPSGRRVAVIDPGPHAPDGSTVIHYIAICGDRP